MNVIERNVKNITGWNADHFIFIALLTIFFILMYHEVISWWYIRSSGADSYYSHAFLIPFISGFFIWRKKNELAEIEPEGSFWGLALILFAVLLHVIGTVLYIFSVSGFSVFFLFLGISLFIYGKKVTKVILFPLLFTIFMFPLPLAIINKISFPMKMLVAESGALIASLMGIPVFREGFQITIPAGELLVGNPCSGLRSLISFLALGAVFAYMINISSLKKWVLFLLAVPVALLSNIVRVPILILVSHYWGLEAAAPESFWHGASGILVFILGVFLLFSAGKMLETHEKV